MAGTWALNLFDRLHIGHHVLIDRLRDMQDPVAAITAGDLVSGTLELAQLIQPPDLRLLNLQEYLKTQDLTKEIDTMILSSYDELMDIKGDTNFLMFDGPCCAEIEENALDVRKNKLGTMDVVNTLKPVRALDGDKMSSARVRLGEIDRTGRKLAGTSELPRKLPDSGRGALKPPKGDVYSTKEGKPEEMVAKRLNKDSPNCVIAVGDVTSATLIDEGFIPDVCVVDGITKRGEYDREFSAEAEYLVYNPAATIYPEAWSAIDSAVNDERKSLVVVEGEEDLMGFPAVLLAEPGSVMLYGQPDVGIIWVPVTVENKKMARDLLEMMQVIS
ncbi:MAG: DUF359 domain-containing protein [Candidatus Thorarchaeota archaeon]|jgi:uncharacterized protein (UPF0218 family)/phosphopantetheine adenylyltransferase